MEPFTTVILAFGGIFTFAFGMAWFLPLSAARTEQVNLFDPPEPPEPPSIKDLRYFGYDLILILLDCVPIFWIFRAIPEIPSTYTAARDKWRREPSIRGCFYAWLISLAVTVGAVFCL